ncbi:uncharacterized protein LOC119685121 [Teleopsis dalmanni]|uniref:uncharacterized protein LOC119681615 n=1 Tax=Teleopsis dalmanni TaxID=139649 RepID=UPI000D32C2D0|nr:uncharacterized protein LOC119681615 [Teleopsis dalmanni]XP_037955255.1 uncharacterized protein LOC119685121 [Teleopsis dalmanni]
MTDHLLSATVDEPPALLSNIAVIAQADGSSSYSDNDYQSEAELERPVLLELGTKPNPTASPSLGAYNSISDYRLNMHLQDINSTPTYLTTHSTPGYGTNGENSTLPLVAQLSSLYTNHYAQPPMPTTTTISPLGASSLASTLSYTSHIPQTVSSWPTADMEMKSATEVVPPPMYVSYINAKEHTIAKDINPSWKEKALQLEKDYKKTACDRERTRMRDMNRAFDLLRSKLPISKPNGKKYSKIESLRIAINYINHLQQCLQEEMPVISTNGGNRMDDSSLNGTDYCDDMDPRRKAFPPFHYERKKTTFKSDRNVDESHSYSNGLWTDNGYIPNGHEKWE